MKSVVAVLALQGAFIEHEVMMKQLGCETMEIRQLSDWHSFVALQREEGVWDGLYLIIPGGESTTMMRLLRDLQLFEPIRTAIIDGLPVMGTCAGMILLAKERLGTMDIEVKRNAYGRQLGSFETKGLVDGVGEDIPMTFIRAPYIEKVYGDAMATAVVDGNIVAARQGKQMACAFHPELTDDTRWHKAFLNIK